MKIRPFRVLPVLLALSLLAVASAQVNIEVWHSLGDAFGAETLQQITDDFNASQDEVVAELIYTGDYTDTLRRAEAALAAGNPPAISMFEQTRGAGFVDAGAILALDDLMSEDVDEFYNTLLSTCRIDGQLWCVPMNTSTPLLYYNKDMFREVGLDPDADFPETWEELLEIGPMFAETDANGELTRWAFGLYTNPGWAFDAWLGQAGGSYLNEDRTEWIFNNEDGLQMANFWLELIENDVSRAMSTSQAYDEFFAGNQAIVYQSTAVLESYMNDAEFDIGVTTLWCGDACYAPIGGGNMYVFDKGDPEIHQAAWDYLDFVTSVENGARLAAATGYHAPRIASQESPILAERFAEVPEAQLTYEQMADYGNSRTLVPFWGEVHNLLTVASQQMLLEGVDPQAALDEAVAEANRLLEIFAQ